jgi:hypothetical protein
MRDHAFIGHSILRQPRSSRVGAIVRFCLASAIAAGIWACRHSESDSSAPAKVAGRWQAGNFQPGRPASAMRDGSWRYGAARLRRFVPDAADGSATITTVPNGTFAPNLYVTGKDSGTFMIMGAAVSRGWSERFASRAANI